MFLLVGVVSVHFVGCWVTEWLVGLLVESVGENFFMLGFASRYIFCLFFPRLPQIITHPMDLGTINRKLAKEGSGGYLEHEEFAADVQLVFDNAMTYNGPVSGRTMGRMAIILFPPRCGRLVTGGDI